jgi:predicted amidohydrolase
VLGDPSSIKRSKQRSLSVFATERTPLRKNVFGYQPCGEILHHETFPSFCRLGISFMIASILDMRFVAALLRIWKPKGDRRVNCAATATKPLHPMLISVLYGVLRKGAWRMYKDIITVSTVTFRPIWGNKAINLNRIKGYVEAAAKKGSDLILFPEMSLTGYDDEPDKPVEEKMQHKLAETVPGPSSQEVAELAKKLGLYVIFGMPIRDDKDPKTVYNGLAVITPTGEISSYHKLHLPAPEPNWATRGDKPYLLQTPWGPIGIGICYDTYSFPELMRYYVAKGARIYLNPTAWRPRQGQLLLGRLVDSGPKRQDLVAALLCGSGNDGKRRRRRGALHSDDRSCPRQPHALQVQSRRRRHRLATRQVHRAPERRYDR